jgi:hypothetical protein
MKRAIAAVLVALVMAGPAWGADGIGFIYIGSDSCGDYLDAYSRTKLTGKSAYSGPHEMWKAEGWISGYITAYNRYVKNGKQNITKSMSQNDVNKWMASWCRDNLTKKMHNGIHALINKLNNR